MNEQTYREQAAGKTLLGQVVTWSTTGCRVRYSQLVQALRSNDLDESAAPVPHHRSAFIRACWRVRPRAHLLDRIADTPEVLAYQLSAGQVEQAENAAGHKCDYRYETVIALKKGGIPEVACDLPEVKAQVEAEMQRCMEEVSVAYLTRTVQRLFDRNADLFPIREQGGAYFVPERFADFLERIDRVVTSLVGRVRRLPVPEGTGYGARSVREVVGSGIAALIDDHRRAVEGFGEDPRPEALERQAEAIRVTRFKIETYLEYLGEEAAQQLRDALAEAAEKLDTRFALAGVAAV